MKKVKNIVLIDDDEPTNYMHSYVIRQVTEECEVRSFTRAQDGLDYLLSLKSEGQLDGTEPELIFLDLNMPGMNGWEFLEEYSRKMPNNSRSAVAILTTSTNPDDFALASKFGQVKKVCQKPLTSDSVREILESM